MRGVSEVKKVLNALFLICICLSLVFALGYVAVQVAGIVTLNGAIAMWADEHLESLVCIMCSVSAVVAFVMSYVCKWKSGD